MSSIHENGPSDSFVFSNPHDRSILCLDADPSGQFCVTGSADHGLRVWDLEKCVLKAELYGKKFGHNEWVTCCAFAADNVVVSAGMDGKVCLWNTQKLCAPHSLPIHAMKRESGVVQKPKSVIINRERIKSCRASSNSTGCREMQAHSASISELSVCLNYNIGISAGYDSCLSIWNVNAARIEATLRGGHACPVLKFCRANSLVCSGDKRGSLCMWDLNTTQAVLKLRNVHDGPVGDICFSQEVSVVPRSAIVITAGQKDGTVAISDMRLSKSTICKKQVHSGAINKIQLLGSSNQFLCTMSADSKCKLFDYTNSGAQCLLNPLASVSASDAIICGTKLNKMEVVAGTGDGKISPLRFSNDMNCVGETTALHGRAIWAHGCKEMGAIHAIKTVPKDFISSDYSGIIAGGDGGHLSYIKF